MEYHPVSELFPMMEGRQYEALRDDIRENGLHEPIWLHPDGRLIDGRNRYRACLETGTPEKICVWDGSGDLFRFVIGLNVRRRTLTKGQLTMAAARLVTTRQGERTDLAQDCAKLSQTEAAKLLGVGRRSVQKACQVLELGIPELVGMVAEGKVGLDVALAISGLDENEQRQLVEQGSDAVRDRARLIRGDHRGANEGEAGGDADRTVDRDDESDSGFPPASVPASGAAVDAPCRPQVAAEEGRDVPAGMFRTIIITPDWPEPAWEVGDGRRPQFSYSTLRGLEKITGARPHDAYADSHVYLFAPRDYLTFAMDQIVTWGFQLLGAFPLSGPEGLDGGATTAVHERYLIVGSRGALPPQAQLHEPIQPGPDSTLIAKVTEVLRAVARHFPAACCGAVASPCAGCTDPMNKEAEDGLDH